MRKFYTVAFYRTSLIITALLTFSGLLNSQTTITTPYTGGLTSFAAVANISFVVENTNGSGIILTGVNQYCETTENNSVWELYYSTTSISGVGTPVPGAAWTLVATSLPVPVAANGIVPVFSGLNLTIPAGAQYRFVMKNTGPGSTRYVLTPNPNTNIFSSGGVNLLLGNYQIAAANVGYSGQTTALGTTPRYWHGAITFMPALPCTAPPNAGSATASPSTAICSGTTVQLGLTGHTTGTGQTYVWQSSSSFAGPYTDISSSSTSPSFSVSPTATTWYKAAVTCSGNTQVSAPIEVVVNPAFPGGTYTINSGAVTGGTNFQTFTEAVAAISCGISGPVVFNVATGSGPYTEQISIPQIGGASAVNTITFNGNNATIQATPTTTDRHIIRLNGADYVTFKKLSIVAVSGSTFGWGVHLTNGADNNKIDSCIIDISTVISTTQSNSAGIVASGSTTAVTTDGSASFNTISNNTIIGAYQGIIMNGATGGLNSVQNVITKNTVQDFYATGIELTDNDGTIVSFNDIHRMNRSAGGSATTIVGTFAGVELGAGNKNCVVNANRIHDTHNNAGSDQGDASYGVFSTACDAPAGNENKVTNNLIYNFNSGNGSGAGIIYALYNSSSDGVFYYHNTVMLDFAASVATGVTRGFYQTTAATRIEVKNNIIYIARGGSALKYCLYFGTTTSTIASNNNVLYNIAAAGTNGIGSFGTTGFATLLDWQGANGSIYDQQSLSVDPAFANPGAGDFYPNNPLLDNAGVGVGVNEDIVGVVRDPISPVPGAYEIIAAAGVDMGVQQLLLPIEKSCYSSSETVTVTIRNYSATSLNFVANPVTINASVTGPNATVFAPVVVNTGSLASNATLDVVISNNYNMSASGIYSFNASTVIASDVNTNNNAMPATDRTVVALTAGVASSAPQAYCVTGGIPTLTLTGSGGGSAIQWQTSSTGLAGSWINTGTNSTTYVPGAAITSTTYYRAYITCGSNTDTSNIVTVAVNNPQLLSTIPATRCGPGTVTLGATASPGSIIKWYEASSGGVAIGTGTSFVTPFINANTTYYVAAGDGGSTVNTGMPAALGTATSGAGTTNFGLVFDVLAPFTLVSVDVYPIAATAGINGTVTIDVIDGSNNILHSAIVNVVGNPAASAVGQTVMLNFNLQPGTNYKLRPGSRSAGITGLLFEPSASAPSGNYGYPYVVPGVLSINTSTLTAAPANTVRNDLYYYFYNWVVSTGCESPRSAVTASVTAAPVFTISQDITVCNNAITTLSVTSTLANFDSYTWAPSAGLFTDAAATTPYTGGSATTVYAKNNTAGPYQYIVTANNSTTLCTNIDTVKLTVLPVSVSITAAPAEVCVSGSTTLSIPSSIDYGSATFQWYSSPDGIVYSAIGGATASSYITPTISATTYYKVEVKNSAAAVCLQPSIMITVNSPQVTGTTAASRCGPGSLTLQATGSTGATLNWYSSASGGTLLGTGSSFTTPTISTTTDYWVAASAGGGSSGVAPMPAQSTTFTGNVRGYWFTSPVSFRITGLRDMGTGAGNQSIAVVRFNPSVTPPTFSATTNAFTTLFLTQNNSATGVIPVNISINAGDVIGILGQRGNVTSYGTPNPYTTTIAGQPVALNRMGMQFPLGTTAPQDLWQEPTSTTIGRVEITYETGCESPKTMVTATINVNTAVTAQPVNQTACIGGNVTFDVTAEGGGLTYQWRKGGVNINGATSSSYTITGVVAGDVGSYDVVITGSCGNATSNAATLALNPATSITTQPTAQSACLGGDVTFNVAASGTGTLTYQWRKAGNNISGATSSSYTITGITAGDVANYDVVVTGDCGPVTSASVALAINAATAITNQPTAQFGCIGGNATFSVTATGTGTLTYQWRKAGNNITGATSSSYTLTNLTAGDAANYDVVVTGTCGSITSASVALTINPVTTITGQPVSQSVCVGGNVTFSVTATGVNLTYQWRKAGNNISGATSSSYTITGLVAGDAGNYDVVVTGICAALNSSTVTLTVNAAGTWLGTVNNNWNTAGNWCGGIPTPTTDVIIAATAPNMPNLSSANGAARNISIANGATLTIGAGGILDLYANISGAGVFNATAGSITFRGATAQTVPAFTAVNVMMNGAGGVTPGGNTTITGALTLINGNITLGSNNLTLNNTSTGSAASHIITNGTGNVVVAGLAASQARTVPVGADATSYNPATLAANAAHVTDNFTVRVQQGVFENGISGTTYTTHVANRMWIINEATAGSSNVNVTLQWAAAQELTSFDRTRCYVMQHNGTVWSQGIPTTATGTDPYAQTKLNVTSFSPFAVETQRIPRPLTGIYPNPTSDVLNVVTDLLSTGPVVFKVYDAKGREVYRRQETLTVGLNQTTLNLTGLSAGVYIIRVSTRLNENFLVQRFLKVN